ncbi:MAG: gliding motility-associated C-terminal domain-containing protein [Saprospiraceae bacterium]
MRKLMLILGVVVFNILGLHSQEILSEYDKGATIFNPYPLCAINGQSYSGTLPDGKFGDQPKIPCDSGSTENPIWFSFTPCSTDVSFTVTSSGCLNADGTPGGGLQVGVYHSQVIDTLKANLGSIQRDDAGDVLCFSGDGAISVAAGTFIAGNTYYLLIDGLFGNNCDFQIHFNSGFLNGLPNAELIKVTTPDSVNGCAPQSFDLNIDFLDYFKEELCVLSSISSLSPDKIYTYQVEPDAYPISYKHNLKSRNQLKISLNIEDEYHGDINVKIDFSDDLPILNCLDDYIISIPVNLMKPVEIENEFFVCKSEFPFTTTVSDDINLGEFTFSDYGVYHFDYLGDTCATVNLMVSPPLPDTTDIGKIIICKDDCFTINNQEFCTAGIHSILVDEDCNKYEKFDLVFNEATSNLPQSITLNCDNPTQYFELNVNSNLVSESCTWKNSDNTVISTEFNVTFSEAGIYTAIVDFSTANGICSQSFEVLVESDENLPEFTLSATEITCSEPISVIAIETTNEIDHYEFSGTKLNGSDDKKILVDKTGQYIVTIYGINGCKSSKTIVVKENLDLPKINIEREPISCYFPVSKLQYTSDKNIVKTEWWHEGTMVSEEFDYNADEAGQYILHLEAENGCSLDTIFNFENISRILDIKMAQSSQWNCNTTELELFNNSSDLVNTEYWWSEDGINYIPFTNSIHITKNTPIYLKALDLESGCINENILPIDLNENNIQDVIYNYFSPLCIDEEFGGMEIEKITGGTLPFRFFLNGNEIDSAEPLESMLPGSYTLQIKDNYDCPYGIEFEIESPETFYLQGKQLYRLKYDQKAAMKVYTNLTLDKTLEFTWWNEDEELVGTGSEVEYGRNKSEKLRVDLENIDGCIISMFINLEFSNEVEWVYPNIFSPNGDGNNDIFSVSGYGPPFEIMTFQIFDRYGGLMYENKDFEPNENPMAWDGKFYGRYAQPGVYVFMLRYVLNSGEEKILTGDITIIR